VLRTIACPTCGERRTTKAGDGIRIRCRACGALFWSDQATKIDEAPQGNEAVAPVAPSPSSESARAAGGLGNDSAPDAPPLDPPGARASGATVEVASGTKVRRNARPRQTPPPAPLPEPAAAPIDAQESGRRGGLGSRMYRERVRARR